MNDETQTSYEALIFSANRSKISTFRTYSFLVRQIMQCEECGRTMLKNEHQCPYCGYVYGPSTRVQFIGLLVALAVLFFIWHFWIA